MKSLIRIFALILINLIAHEAVFSQMGQTLIYEPVQSPKVFVCELSQKGDSATTLQNVILHKLQGCQAKVKFQDVSIQVIAKLSYEVLNYGIVMQQLFKENFGLSMSEYMQKEPVDKTLKSQFRETDNIVYNLNNFNAKANKYKLGSGSNSNLGQLIMSTPLISNNLGKAAIDGIWKYLKEDEQTKNFLERLNLDESNELLETIDPGLDVEDGVASVSLLGFKARIKLNKKKKKKTCKWCAKVFSPNRIYLAGYIELYRSVAQQSGNSDAIQNLAYALGNVSLQYPQYATY